MIEPKVDVGELVAALEKDKSSHQHRAKQLAMAFDEFSLWESYLFGKIDHVSDLEEMLRIVEKEIVYLGAFGFFSASNLLIALFFELSLAWTYYSDHRVEWSACKVDKKFS